MTHARMQSHVALRDASSLDCYYQQCIVRRKFFQPYDPGTTAYVFIKVTVFNCNGLPSLQRRANPSANSGILGPSSGSLLGYLAVWNFRPLASLDHGLQGEVRQRLGPRTSYDTSRQKGYKSSIYLVYAESLPASGKVLRSVEMQSCPPSINTLDSQRGTRPAFCALAQ